MKKNHQYVYGRRFEIKTDYKPLTHIFSESKGTPTMASGRLQRWALTLGAYDYAIQYRQGSKNSNADALSRVPLPSEMKEVPRPVEVVQLMEHLDTSTLSSSQIKSWTDRDPKSESMATKGVAIGEVGKVIAVDGYTWFGKLRSDQKSQRGEGGVGF